MLRPRSSLARALYEKFKVDEELKMLDKKEWYEIAPCQLVPEIQKTFLQMAVDEETEEFLKRSEIKSSWIPTQIWHLLVRTFLNVFMTQTSINGLLRRGSMFVFSRQQFEKLISWSEISSAWNTTKPKLLDLGAGDGVVTSIISSLFDEVYVTEISPTMKWILTEKGFRILDPDTWARHPAKFQVVTCLNLLDRCDRPCDILRDMKEVLAPGGIVVLALVLPFRPYVETDAKNHSPCQILDIKGCTFESQVAAAIKNVLEPNGYEVVKWTKLPYLCEGDLRQSYYWLEDVVFVLKKVSSR